MIYEVLRCNRSNDLLTSRAIVNTNFVRTRYGDRLTPAQLDELRKIVAGQLEAARALRAVALANADEPMQPFAPYRNEP